MPDGSRVLITGISSRLASLLASRLDGDERVEAIIGVGLQAPARDLGRTRIVRGELRSPTIAPLLQKERIDTLVHLAIASTPQQAGGRGRMKENNVIQAMQLFAAAQQAPAVRKVVMRSTTAVYGSNPGDPALFAEDVPADASQATGFTKDTIEAEGYARRLARRRQDIVLTVLRFANLLGGGVDGTLARYFSLPVLPTVLGYDPRIQLCHGTDAVEVLYRSCVDDHPGIINVAGPGVMYLSQAARISGRPTLPVPLPFVSSVAGGLRRLGLVDFSADQLRFLSFGRVGDITRLRQRLGYEPRYTTRAAFESYLVEQGSSACRQTASVGNRR